MCSEVLFPFNHYFEQENFIRALSEMRFSYNQYCITELNKMLFTPFEIDEEMNDSDVYDVDPDLNVFDDVRLTTSSSVYYCEETFNSAVDDIKNDCLLSFFSLNIRSIPKNLDKLSLFLDLLRFKFAFIGITENWLNDSNADLYSLDGYIHEEKHRSNMRGGGVSLFIKNSIHYLIRDDLNIFENTAETLFIEIDKSVFNTNKNIVIGVIYRIPDKDVNIFNTKFNNVLIDIKNNNKLCYLLGDYNINLLNSNSHSQTQDFVDNCFTNGCIPMINKPTRITQYSATLIDNIITNNILNISCIQGLLLTDISDHLPVVYINKDNRLQETDVTIKKRLLNIRNINKFKSRLSEFSFEDLYKIENGQEATSYFCNQINSLYDQCFPVKTLKKRYCFRKPWLTDGLRNSIKCKNKLYRIYMKTKSLVDHKRYKMYRNKLHHLLRSSERRYYQELLGYNKDNLRKTWMVIKEIINKKKSSVKTDYFLHNNKKITNNKDIANLFNDFFVNIGKSLSQKIPVSQRNALSYFDRVYNRSLFLIPTHAEELRQIIKNIRKDGSSGYDDFSPKVFCSSYESMLDPLVYIINLSLSQGFFPDELKIAKVIPLFKGGDSHHCNNYRPVSVLCILSKVFERIFYKRLLNFLNQEAILYDKQFGFRKSNSTQMPLVLLVDEILKAFENKSNVLGVFLDFSKAFDTVNHSILLQKLEYYGIRGTALDWIKSYLFNRKQFVYYGGEKSCLKTISHGVPQGSILGPLLFLIYINDLPLAVKHLSIFMFADDTNVFLTGKNVRHLETIMNNELELLSEWLRSNKLSLNVNKTHYMLFTPPKKNDDILINLNIEGSCIEKVYQTKFLGVILDKDLSWKPHIAYVKGKISKNIGIIYRAKQFLNKQSLLSLYYAFIFPYLVYCVNVWGGACTTSLLPIVIAQKKAIKCILCVSKRTRSDQIYKALNVLTFSQIYEYQILLFVYKYKCNLLPKVFNGFLIKSSEVNSYNTRQLLNYYLPRFRLDIYKTGFKYNACFFWNKLSSDAKKMNVSISEFKKKILTIVKKV
jgi:hypothetical protein